MSSPAAPADTDRPVRIEDFPVNLPKAAIRTRVVEEIATASEGETIEEARVIVSAGRGCGEPSNLDLVRRLARRLNGTMAGSRAIVELGWIPHTRQVGQSGTTVGPDLYIAVGISGAIQHVVGMSSSRKVVAINKDPDAPIFKVARHRGGRRRAGDPAASCWMNWEKVKPDQSYSVGATCRIDPIAAGCRSHRGEHCGGSPGQLKTTIGPSGARPFGVRSITARYAVSATAFSARRP